MNITKYDLKVRIAELEDALREARDSCAYNLEEPGNENDTFDAVISIVDGVLHDNYVFNMAKYMGDE